MVLARLGMSGGLKQDQCSHAFQSHGVSGFEFRRHSHPPLVHGSTDFCLPSFTLSDGSREERPRHRLQLFGTEPGNDRCGWSGIILV